MRGIRRVILVRENSGKNQTKNLERIASQLVKRMEIARTKWFDACIEGIRMMAKVSKWSQEVDSALKRNTDSMIKSFQLVHALSFINMKGYLSSSEMGPFNNILCDYICGAELDKCLPSI